jgi:hypothetical protein
MRLISALVLLILAPAVRAETPEQRARMYFSAIGEGKYTEAAGHVEPGQLKEFRAAIEVYEGLPADQLRDFVKTVFGKDETPESVKAKSDSQFFAAFLDSVTRQAAAVGGLRVNAPEILGQVKEGEDVVHLVTRNRVGVGSVEVEAMEVLSLKKHGEEWRVLMSGELKGLPDQIRAAIANAGNR